MRIETDHDETFNCMILSGRSGASRPSAEVERWAAKYPDDVRQFEGAAASDSRFSTFFRTVGHCRSEGDGDLWGIAGLRESVAGFTTLENTRLPSE